MTIEILNSGISDICIRAQDVTPGAVYFAIKGNLFNGEDFIAEALARGAKTIVLQGDPNLNYQVDGHNFVYTHNIRLELSNIAKQLFTNQPQHIAAVTGTNGKTSTVHFFQRLTAMLGFKSASLGTLGVETNAKLKINTADYRDQISLINQSKSIEWNGSITTPDPILLHHLLHDLHNSGIEYLSIEASSHGLDQYRLDNLKIEVAAFTNLTQDHLDYHYNMENYFISKMRLFKDLLASDSATVINIDDDYAKDVIKICKQQKHKIITYGFSEEADIVIKPDSITWYDQNFKHRLKAQMPMFQISNAICASIMLHSINPGIPIRDIIALLEKIDLPVGRMEKLATYHDADIYVDFAHTPDGLEKILSSLRQMCKGKLWVVFGCGGNRDPFKRKKMGDIAKQFADYTIITDDNPRNEDPAKIRKMVKEGCPEATEIGDRAQAITHAVHALQKGDILVIAGKGHESVQIIGNNQLPFSDRDTVKQAILK